MARMFAARARIEVLVGQHPAAQDGQRYQPEADEYLDKNIAAQAHGLGVLAGDGELIADAADTDNHFVSALCGQLFTNLADMDIDAAIIG